MNSFQTFIDFVTTAAFVVTPITAILNHLVMFSSRVPENYRPKTLLRNWSLLGIVAHSDLALMFIYVRFFRSGKRSAYVDAHTSQGVNFMLLSGGHFHSADNSERGRIREVAAS